MCRQRTQSAEMCKCKCTTVQRTHIRERRWGHRAQTQARTSHNVCQTRTRHWGTHSHLQHCCTAIGGRWRSGENEWRDADIRRRCSPLLRHKGLVRTLNFWGARTITHQHRECITYHGPFDIIHKRHILIVLTFNDRIHTDADCCDTADDCTKSTKREFLVCLLSLNIANKLPAELLAKSVNAGDPW